MHVDEWITFKDMGAYTISSLNAHNITPFPNVYAIANHTVWLVSIILFILKY